MGINDFGGSQSRRNAFAPGGKLAQHLACHRNVIIKIGDFLFVHGGVLPKHIKNKKETIKEINHMMRRYLLGETGLLDLDYFQQLFVKNDGILWTRNYSHADQQPRCDLLDETLKLWKLNGMIVGHSVQKGINSQCSGKIWRVDVGMSGAFGPDNHQRVQVLEIINNGSIMRVLKDRKSI